MKFAESQTEKQTPTPFRPEMNEGLRMLAFYIRQQLNLNQPSATGPNTKTESTKS